jgi:hypothetical protein
MATLAEGLALLLAKPQPPWSTQTLRALFNSNTLSLRAVLNAVDARVVLLFIEVRPTSLLLDGNPSFFEFLTRWAAPTAPTGAQMDTINSLNQIFRPLGVTIVYISNDGGTIGIAGTVASLLKIQAFTLNPNTTQGGQNQAGLSNLGQGLVATGAGFAALGAAGAVLDASTGLVAGLLVIGGFLGFTGAGLFVGVAVYQLIAGASTPTTSSDVTGPPIAPGGIPVDPSIGRESCGQAPDNLQQSTVEQLLDYFNANGTFPELPNPGQLPEGVGDGGDDGAGDGGIDTDG